MTPLSSTPSLQALLEGRAFYALLFIGLAAFALAAELVFPA